MRLLVISLAIIVANAQINTACTSDEMCHNKASPCTGRNCVCDPETSTCRVGLGKVCRGHTQGCQSGTVCSGGRCLALQDQTCTEGLCLLHGVCVQEKCRASPGYAWSPTTQTYRACNSNCETCYLPNDPQACLTCTDDDKVAIDGTCICMEGAADENGVCAPCDPICETCAVPETPFGCTSCALASMTLISGVCICPLEMAWNEETRNCESCDSSCATCSVPGDPNYCTSCNTGTLVNGNCVTDQPKPEECPYGMAPNDNNVCLPCHHSCRTCLFPLHPNRCSSCSRGKRLVGGTCVPYKVRYKKFKRPCPRCPELMASINGVCKCIRGYVGDSKSPSVSDTYCSPCDASCLTCYAPQDPEACTSCYRWMYPQNGRCAPEPGPGPNPPIVCSPVCETCTTADDPNQCTSCTMGNSLLTQGKCYCPAGTYNVSNTCEESCAFPCSECYINDNSICTACPENLIPLGGTCVCPNATALSPIMPLNLLRNFPSQPRCLPCHVSCATCAQPENPLACTECADPRAALTNGECLCPDSEMIFSDAGLCECPSDMIEMDEVCFGMQCPEGTFPFENQCVPCEIPNCETCESLDTCAECELGYYLSEGSCFECGLHCVSCTDSDQCEVCEEGYEVVDGACVESCPPCCQSCTFDANGPICTSCINNYVYTNGQCATCSEGIPHCVNCRNCACTRCEAGYYLLNSTHCELCSATIPFCKICNGPDVCLLCEDGYHYDPIKKRCVRNAVPPVECPDGTYRTKRGDCNDCYFNCKTCIGPGKNMCTECFPNSILYPELGFNWGRCICRGGFWFDRDHRCCVASTSAKPKQYR